MKILGIIPARYESSRFPGKPLVKIGGLTMIERVYRQACLSKHLSEVIVATDDQRILNAVHAFGGDAVMTRKDHLSGTDRLAEIAAARTDVDIVVNVQGDEPLIDPYSIDSAIKPLIADPSVEMSTIAAPITDQAEINSPDTVKVVIDKDGTALYFSRCPIPYYRDANASERQHFAHFGLYVYRRQTLLKIAALAATALEKAEALEQLRALENGIRIKVVTGKFNYMAVDRPADVIKIENALMAASI